MAAGRWLWTLVSWLWNTCLFGGVGTMIAFLLVWLPKALHTSHIPVTWMLFFSFQGLLTASKLEPVIKYWLCHLLSPTLVGRFMAAGSASLPSLSRRAYVCFVSLKAWHRRLVKWSGWSRIAAREKLRLYVMEQILSVHFYFGLDATVCCLLVFHLYCTCTLLRMVLF